MRLWEENNCCIMGEFQVGFLLCDCVLTGMCKWFKTIRKKYVVWRSQKRLRHGLVLLLCRHLMVEVSYCICCQLLISNTSLTFTWGEIKSYSGKQWSRVYSSYVPKLTPSVPCGLLSLINVKMTLYYGDTRLPPSKKLHTLSSLLDTKWNVSRMICCCMSSACS